MNEHEVAARERARTLAELLDQWEADRGPLGTDELAKATLVVCARAHMRDGRCELFPPMGERLAENVPGVVVGEVGQGGVRVAKAPELPGGVSGIPGAVGGCGRGTGIGDAPLVSTTRSN